MEGRQELGQKKKAAEWLVLITVSGKATSKGASNDLR